ISRNILKSPVPERRPGQSAYRNGDNQGGRLRLFFALWPAPGVARALHTWGRAAQAVTGGRLTREETIHLTLAFLGDVPGERVAALIDCARRVKGRAFGLAIDEGRRWEHNRIAWAGPREMPEALADLAAQLDAHLKAGGFRTEKRDFKAHISLVRRTEQGGVLPALPPVAWRADEFVLVRSSLS
ncbi:unnamed protein product, partial [Phaeothamnion confervicola]